MEQINIVWFTNDLRLNDHAPLFHAQQAGVPVLLLYCFDPVLLHLPVFSERHGWFVLQSLADMQQCLKPYNKTLYTAHLEMTAVLSLLTTKYRIRTLFVHRQTGMMQQVQAQHMRAKEFCIQNSIEWLDFARTGVFETVQSTEEWEAMWKRDMQQPQFNPTLPDLKTVTLPDSISAALLPEPVPKDFKKGGKHFKPDSYLQQPGQTNAMQLLNRFLQTDAKEYRKRKKDALQVPASGSHLSAYLAFGNISARQIYQRIRQIRPKSAFSNELKAFSDALILRCFCVQQFALHANMEQENLNYAVNGIRIKWNEALFDAFKSGNTGFPLVDAAVVCLKKTGFINHNLRILLASFVTHQLWLDWRKAAAWFAQQMIDFEPGILYWYLQTVSGCTGVYPATVTDPAKEARKSDKQGLFIKKWIPQFAHVPGALCGNPSAMSVLEQKMYHCEVGKDYLAPIIDINQTKQFALAELQRVYQKPMAQKETARLAQQMLPLPAALHRNAKKT